MFVMQDIIGSQLVMAVAARMRVHYPLTVLNLVCAVAKITMMVLSVTDVRLDITAIQGVSSVHATFVGPNISSVTPAVDSVPVKVVSVASTVIYAVLDIMVFLIARLVSVILLE